MHMMTWHLLVFKTPEVLQWKPVLSSESTMKKVLKHFMEKWADGLCRWLFNAQPTKEEAMA